MVSTAINHRYLQHWHNQVPRIVHINDPRRYTNSYIIIIIIICDINDLHKMSKQAETVYNGEISIVFVVARTPVMTILC